MSRSQLHRAFGLGRTKYLQQLRKARRPKPETIARIRALIDGRPLPPPANVARACSRRR
jgi:hypothetical protein